MGEEEAATAPAAAATTPAAAATTTTPVATTTVGPTTTVGNVTTAGNTTASNVTETKVTWTMKTSPVSSLPKYTTVFGVPVFAASSITDAKFQHAASVLAEWLDNDEDGCVDNPTVLTALLAKHNGDQTAIV